MMKKCSQNKAVKPAHLDTSISIQIVLMKSCQIRSLYDLNIFIIWTLNTVPHSCGCKTYVYLVSLRHILWNVDFSWLVRGFNINPLMLKAAKTTWQFLWNLSNESIVEKIFEGELLIRTLPTTLLQIFCKISCNSKVIVKSIIDPDDNFQRMSKALMG